MSFDIQTSCISFTKGMRLLLSNERCHFETEQEPREECHFLEFSEHTEDQKGKWLRHEQKKINF